MNGVFIKPKSVEELEFVSALLKKIRIQSKIRIGRYGFK